MRRQPWCKTKEAFFEWQRSLRSSPRMFASNHACAVIGSSGMLYKSRHGAWIDKHDIILRVNYAPTRGFERDVGTRTTARVMQMDAYSNDPQYRAVLTGKVYNHSRGDELRLVSCHEPFHGRCTQLRISQVFRNTSSGSAHLLSADVSRRCNKRFEPSAMKNRQRSVSSGMLAVEVALRIKSCKMVRLFGFADGAVGSRCYHYYDNLSDGSCRFTEAHFFDPSMIASSGYHDFDAQARVLRMLNVSSMVEWVI